MGINVLLTTYGKREVLDSVLDPKGAFASAIMSSGKEGTYCLQFIDPWGSAVFNGWQAAHLERELQSLIGQGVAAEAQEIIRRAIEMARRCTAEVHLFVAFEGD